MAYSELNVKAAAITGAVIGVLCWLLLIPYGFSGYGMMGYYLNAPFHGLSAFSIVLDAVIGGLFGTVLAWTYNLALKIK